jgi:hypothetical protein
MIQTFRKSHEWQTEDGRRRISEARKDMIPVVCSITREPMGSVHRDDPRIKSGELMHHSRGYISVMHVESGKTVRLRKEEYHENKHLYITLFTLYN